MLLKPSSSAVTGFRREARWPRTPTPAASFQRLFPISKSNHLLIIEATRANPITRRQPFPDGKSVSRLPRWPNFWGAFFCVRFLFVSGPPAALKVSSPWFFFLEATPFSYPVPFPSSKETSPPLRRLCLQAKFTAAPGLSLRRCRPGAGMAEAVDRALFICKGGRLSDSLAWLPFYSSVFPSGLAGVLDSP